MSAERVTYRRRPFCLRPERDRQQPWLTVLRELGRSRGNSNWADGDFVPRMTANGRLLGIAFDFGGDVGNSLDSLRLLQWAQAKAPEKSEELADLLSKWHFEERRCVSDPAVLIAAVSEVGGGLTAAEAEEVLAGDAYQAEVDAMIEDSHENGHHSIPVITLTLTAGGEDGGITAELGGARSPDEYSQVLEALRQRLS